MPTNPLSIYKATPADAPILTELSITTFCDTFMPDNKKEDMDKYVADELNEEKIAAELSDTDNIFFLASNDSSVIGYAKLRTLKKPETVNGARPIELERLYVLKVYHDMGAGAALMQHCINFAMDVGHDVMWLGVWEHNHRAVKFYKRWGFEFCGSHNFVLGEDVQTDLLMRKQLLL